MKNEAIGFSKAVDLQNIAYERREVALSAVTENEVRVKVLAVSVNPVDAKMQEAYTGSDFRVLGFDACGEIVEVGSQVTDFAVGERVYYAGQQLRPGANQRYQVVDAALIAKAPANWSNAQAASLPLTAITAAELLTDAFGLKIAENSASGRTIFVINGAGGVGSILIQLAKFMGMRVITTASRPETVAWVKQLGADQVINHHQDLKQQLSALTEPVDKLEFIAILHSTNTYWDFASQAVAPFGRIASIVETTGPIDLAPLKNIGAQFCWEFMFAKGNYGVRMAEQGAILGQLSQLIEAGKIQPTLTKTYQGFSSENLAQATSDVAAGRMIGKVAVTFD